MNWKQFSSEELWFNVYGVTSFVLCLRILWNDWRTERSNIEIFAWFSKLHTSINLLFQQHQTSVFCYFKNQLLKLLFFKQIASPWFNGWKIVMDWKFAAEFSVIKISRRFIYANFCSINLFSDNPQLKNDLQIEQNWICVGIIPLLNEKTLNSNWKVLCNRISLI